MNTGFYMAAPRAEIGQRIIERVRRYYSNTRVMEIMAKQRIAYRYYYDLGLDWAGWGTPGTTNQMQRGGDEGELALIRINHARSLVRGQIAMVSSSKFDRHPRASSEDYDALRATEQCGFVLDHYQESGGLERRRIERIESSSTMGEGYTWYAFDKNAGKIHATDPQTNRPVRTGDVVNANVLPWDVIKDPYREWDAQRQITVHFPRVNRYELAAEHPEFERQILDSPTQSVVPFFTPVASVTDGPSPDDTEIYWSYCLPSTIPGLERGRAVKCLSDGTVLEDTILATDVFPIVRVAEAGVMGAPFGYPSFWEYLGVQELYDNLQSVVATNQSTFGAQNIAVKTGVDPRPVQLGGGLSVYICDDPKNDVMPLQLTKSPAEVFPHMQDLRRNMELLSGQTTIDRGEAQGDRQSGSMGALLSNLSIRNASPYQTSDVEALKQESSLILRLLRANAMRPIRIGIAERGRTPYEAAITGHDLGNVDAVDIELANPLMQTMEGKIAFLQTLAQLKTPVTADQAMEIITWGRLEPATDGATREGMRIRLENQQIAKGQKVRAMLSDNAVRHCKEHILTMSDSGRDDPAVQAAFVEHTEDHYRLFYGTDPEQDKLTGLYRPKMLALFGIQPPPPDPAQGPPPGAPEIGPGGATQKALPAAQSPGGSPEKGPRLPTNPQSGQQWTPGPPSGAAPPRNGPVVA